MFLDKFFGGVIKLLITINILLVVLLVVKIEISWTSNMVFYISPVHTYVDAYNNEIRTVRFKLETQSTYLCVLECNYEFVDLSTNTTIDKGSLAFSKYNDSIQNYAIRSPLLGAGQKVYNFNVACSNRRTITCWFKNPERHASSIVIMNYRLREEEETLKRQLGNSLQNILLQFAQADILKQEQEIKISETDTVLNFNELNEGINQSENSFIFIRDTVKHLTGLWENEDYFVLEDDINSSLDTQLANATDAINKTNRRIDEAIAKHNAIVNSIEAKKQNIRAMLNFFLVTTPSESEISEANKLSGLINSISNDFQTRNFTTYDEINYRIAAGETQYNKVRALSDANLVEVLKRGYSLLNQTHELMCSLKGYCIEPLRNDIFANTKNNILQVDRICKSTVELGSSFKKADDNFTLSYYFKTHALDARIDANSAYSALSSELHLKSYTDNPEFINISNSIRKNKVIAIKNNYIRKLNEISERCNMNTSILNSNLNSSASKIGNETLFDYCDYLIKRFNYENNPVKNQFLFADLQDACNEFFASIRENNTLSPRNVTMIKNIAFESELPFNEISQTNQTLINIPDEIFTLITNFTYSEYDAAYQNLYCTRVSSNTAEKSVDSPLFKDIAFLKLNLSYAAAKKYTIKTRVNTSLKEPFPICCVFGSCERCCVNESCRDEPSLFPVILLHGHAFNKEESPTFSFDIFDNIDNELQNDGYVNSGTVFPNPNYTGVKENELGAIRKPVSIKASYYLDFNSEFFTIDELNHGIDDYTSRLNDIIRFVRYRTGKSKVDIIAHSMGALLARRYLEVYGESDVDKLIMIASPNKGISEKTRGMCLIAGREKECYDMTNNSQFMKTINSIPLKNKTKIYNIYANGCETDGIYGDRIITAESARFDGAENYEIKANCTSMFDVPHLEILDTDRYPETYRIIKGILKED